ncbi:MAG TPA: DNA primase [Gemmatimonadaceae bacterium]
MIPNEVVDRVRDAADVIEIIGEQVKLRRVGTSWRGACPFHGGKNPNFSVNPRTGAYHCFKCHESGDIFSFVQKRMGMDFVEAVKYVGGRSGVVVEEVEQRREERDRFAPYYEANAAAAEFFAKLLWESPAAAGAREYLESRQLSRADAERFALGFSPRDDSLREHLHALGVPDAVILESGLAVHREDDAEGVIRPRFRGRLMFPIHDVQGRVVAFGGRVIGQGEPKYLNSPESPIFVKGRTLYGLHWARHAIRRDERALVVEGYVDAVRLALAGIESVVAPLGTALTEEQATLLARYTKTVYLLYDSDQAGLKATFRAGDELLRQGVAVQVVTLPEGEDPDTFVRAHGAARMEQQLAHGIDIFERKIQLLERAGWFADLRRKRKALDRLIPTIRATSDPITRDLYLGRAADVAGVSREMLAHEVAQPEPAPGRGGGASSHREEEGGREESRGGSGGRFSGDRGRERGGGGRGAPFTSERRQGRASEARFAERELLRHIVHVPGMIEAAAERIAAEDLKDPQCRALYAQLLAFPEGIDFEALGEMLDPAGNAFLEELRAEAGGLESAREYLDRAGAQFKARDIRARLVQIDRELPLADAPEQDRLTSEKLRLKAELVGLGVSRWKAVDRGGMG